MVLYGRLASPEADPTLPACHHLGRGDIDVVEEISVSGGWGFRQWVA
jgi:hypothetical protein